MQDQEPTNDIFTDDEMKNFTGLYSALKRVHDRLIREGYEIKYGEIKLPPSTS